MSRSLGLAGVDIGYGEAETYLYDSEGRRSEAQRNEPRFHVQRLYYQKDDHGADRLVGIDRSMVLHDDNGFRMYLEKQNGSHERYRYAPDYRLISVEKDGLFIEFEHDQNGQRVAKYVGAELAERYQWHDLVRMARAQVHGATMEFHYANGSRVPFAMTRNDQDFRLYYDQVGSLRVVADAHGNVIKETLYDSFGLIQKETNPGFIIPLGFAGGLHDQDIGWVRFGYRDYDPLTGRFTAKDPIGYAGGDSDVYGYCLDDPVNLVDPQGLWTVGIDGSGSIAVRGYRVDAGLGLHVDENLDVGLTGHVDGYKTTDRAGAGLTIGLQTTDADSVDDLGGFSSAVGGTARISGKYRKFKGAVGVGHEEVIGKGYAGNNYNLEVSVGKNIPPLEFHGGGQYAVVKNLTKGKIADDKTQTRRRTGR